MYCGTLTEVCLSDQIIDQLVSLYEEKEYIKDIEFATALKTNMHFANQVKDDRAIDKLHDEFAAILNPKDKNKAMRIYNLGELTVTRPEDRKFLRDNRNFIQKLIIKFRKLYHDTLERWKKERDEGKAGVLKTIATTILDWIDRFAKVITNLVGAHVNSKTADGNEINTDAYLDWDAY